MATWFSSKEEFVEVVRQSGCLGQAAPLPSDFPENAHNSRSYWIREHATCFDEDGHFTNAALPEEVDVVIIGSGITGATVAHQISLLQPDLSVAVLEARGVCSGATGRNGGHLGRPNAYDARKLAKLFGDEEAVRLREFGTRNKDALYECVAKAGWLQEVDLRYHGTIVVFGDAEERNRYREDDQWCRERGMDVRGEIMDQEQTLQVSRREPILIAGS